MQNVFFIDPQAQTGSLGRYDYELLSRMKDCNISFFGGKTYDFKSINPCKSHYWFNYTSYGNPILKGLSYICTMLRILFMILIERPYVIHIQWIRLPVFDYPFYYMINKIFRKKLVYTVHNILPHKIKKNDYSTYKRFYDLCDVLIVHTLTAKGELSAKFNIDSKKIYVAPHGPLAFIEEDDKLEMEIRNLEKKYDLKHKIVFSIIGTQSEYKGTDLLIDAWRSSKKLNEHTDVTLVVAGKNTNKYINPKIDKNIKAIDGHLSNLTFNALIRRSDVIVLPYRRIEQSGVLLSFIKEHIPYCATNVGELVVPIIKENIGWIIPEISSKSIQKTIESIVDNKDTIIEKKNNFAGWERICDYYDWNNSAAITRAIYEEIGEC